MISDILSLFKVRSLDPSKQLIHLEEKKKEEKREESKERGKLVLTLCYGDEVKIGDASIFVLKRSPTQVRVVFHAPKDISIKRVKDGNPVPRKDTPDA